MLKISGAYKKYNANASGNNPKQSATKPAWAGCVRFWKKVFISKLKRQKLNLAVLALIISQSG
ncbi:MAG: hypothetical protein WCV68_01895 [Candidatus Paceibacterota bacterium]|jgi:hypothetical protein